jgi:hypothetical protein
VFLPQSSLRKMASGRSAHMQQREGPRCILLTLPGGLHGGLHGADAQWGAHYVVQTPTCRWGRRMHTERYVYSRLDAHAELCMHMVHAE